MNELRNMLNMQTDGARTDLVLTLLWLMNMLGKFLAVASVVSVCAYTVIAAMFDRDGFLGTPLWQWQLRGLGVLVFGLLIAFGTAWLGRLLTPQAEPARGASEPPKDGVG